MGVQGIISTAPAIYAQCWSGLWTLGAGMYSLGQPIFSSSLEPCVDNGDQSIVIPAVMIYIVIDHGGWIKQVWALLN